MKDHRATPAKPFASREEEADRALRNTVIGTGAARFLAIAFLTVISFVPFLEVAVAARRDPGRVPEPLRVHSLLPSLAEVRSARTPSAVFGLLPQARAIRDYEDALENGSILSDWLIPPMQAQLARWGAGNEKAYCGVAGRLFYRPDVDYVTGPGFLSRAFLRSRALNSENGLLQPDPVPAILRFERQLGERGIELVVTPVPSKPMIHPEKLYPGLSSRTIAPQNSSFPKFAADLRRHGVRVFDPTAILMEAKRRSGREQFLQTDTHWTPAAMELVAAGLGAYIREHRLLPASEPARYSTRAAAVENQGDIALMLKLPPGQTLYARQRVVTHPVYAPDGSPWKPDRDADVLLLGDSYTSIYSLAGMGWGTHAGLAEELSVALGRPLDRIAVNDGGSYTTREQLLREAARGKDRLKGKRLVIWQFAMRDLMEGDWKLLDIPRPEQETERTMKP